MVHKSGVLLKKRQGGFEIRADRSLLTRAAAGAND
jgi:hypothetical protein